MTRGQRAWGRIKATAVEQRQLWKEVGEALMVGRKLHTSDKLFGQWCTEHGFDMHRNDRSAALWLAENWGFVQHRVAVDISHPRRVMEAFRELEADTPPTPEVDLSNTPAPRQRLTIETTKKVNKLASMAEGGEGQEQETAKRYLKKQADLVSQRSPAKPLSVLLFGAG